VNQIDISTKRQDIKQRLKLHDAARKLIEAELLGLQHICEHPNAKKWNDGDIRGSTNYFQCPDCGLDRSY
jgi:hypothetical protein